MLLSLSLKKPTIEPVFLRVPCMMAESKKAEEVTTVGDKSKAGETDMSADKYEEYNYDQDK